MVVWEIILIFASDFFCDPTEYNNYTMQKIMFGCLWRGIIMVCTVILYACSENEPAARPVPPEIPAVPTDSIPASVPDSIPASVPDSIPQEKNNTGVSTTINGWDTDSIDNGGKAE